MHPKNISIRDYTFDLPESRIAFHPLEERDQSKLLIYQDGKIHADTFLYIDEYIPSGSLMLFNNTRVVAARILFQKPTGGVVEIFCLEPHEQYPDITTAMAMRSKVLWKCLVGGASKWKAGQVLEKKITRSGQEIILHAKYIEKRVDHFIIEFTWEPESETFASILQLMGNTPLPPYIKRVPDDADISRYQTIYALTDGSVAAPTAGLHFTQRVLEKMRGRGVEWDYLTLHVGAGTFKPVKADTMEGHEMHSEYIEVRANTIERILSNEGRPVIAVGTTSLRTIESLYWLGVKCILKQDPTEGLMQWDPYDLETKNISSEDALTSLLDWMKQNKLDKLVTKTKIIIAPGYKIKCVDALVTNFHQPGSTLLLLVAAIIGDDWNKVYDYALSEGFRFLSYGDANLLWVKKD